MSINKHFRIRNGLSVNTAGSNATVEIAANDAILLPRGASGERPATAANGMFRYNTTSGGFEGYIAGAWTALTDATTASDMETSTYDPAGVSEQLVGLTAIQTLTNKTLTSPTLTSPTINTSVALPANAVDAITEIAAGIKSGIDGTLITGTSGTSTHLAQWDANGDLVTAGKAAPSGAIVGTTDSQTLTNKTLTSPTINTSVALPSNAVDAITEISASIRSGSDTTLITGTAGTNGSLAQWNVDGDLVTLAAPAGSLVGTTATQTLTNKTLTSPIINTSISLPSNAVDAITEIASGIKSGIDATLITGTAGTNGSLAQWDTNGDLITLAAPAGSLVGTTATQTLTNKTLTSPVLTTPRVSSGTMNVQSGSLTVGVTHSTNGLLDIYGGTTGEDGGVFRLFNAVDDDTNTDFWVLAANSASAGDFTIAGGTVVGFRIDQSTDIVTLAEANGQVHIGTNDSVPAQLHLYGGGTGELGGEVRLYMDADVDGASNGEFWRVAADPNANFSIDNNATTVGMYITPNGTVALSTVAGAVSIGGNDSVPGALSIFGGGTGELGGELRIYNNADDDGNVDYWKFVAEDSTGNLFIGTPTGNLAIGFTDLGVQPLVMGQLAIQCVPGGRLTMVTGDRQLGSDSNGTTIYYTQAHHNRIPLYNGSEWVLHYYSELTNVTTNATANPAATSADSLYDFFIWDDGGTIKMSRGPAWTSNTSRGTGAGTTQLSQQDTIYVNAVNITNGPAAGTGTYVGTARTNGSNNWQLRRLATGSTGNETLWLAVYNFYNQIAHTFHCDPTGGSYTYNSTSRRTYAGNTNLRHGFCNGSPSSGLFVFCHFYTYTNSGDSGNNRQNIGFGIDQNDYEGTSGVGRGPNQTAGHHIAIHASPVISSGWRRLYMVENADNTGGVYTSYPNDTTMSGVVVM